MCCSRVCSASLSAWRPRLSTETPDDPARHGAAELLVGGEVGGVGPAVAEGHAEALRVADCDIGAELAGRCQQDEAEQVGRDRDHRSLPARLLDNPGVVRHRAADFRVLQQDAEERPFRQPGPVIAHLDLDADGLGAGLHHRDGLRQAGVGDEEAVAAVLGDAVAHVHGLGRRRAFVEQRGVGAAKPGEVHHHGLEVEQGLQPAPGKSPVDRACTRCTSPDSPRMLRWMTGGVMVSW